MKLSNLEQGSLEWLEIRKNKITSTDASIINGTNTFRGNSPFKLWQQKLGIEKVEFQNMRMLEGSRLEIKAREWFNKKYSTNFKPQVLFNDTYDWIMASLDGFEENSDYIIEIKCGESTYDKATKGFVPPYYFDQIQHQLYASGKHCCHYVAYRPDKDPVVIIIKRDEQFLKTLIEKEIEFYDFLVKLSPPPLAEKEFVEIKDGSVAKLAHKWREANEILKNVQEIEKTSRQLLLDETDDGNCIIPDANIKIERRIKKGNIDYEKVFKENNITYQMIEKYRKPEISWLQPIILN